MAIPSGYSLVLTKTGSSVGPGSKFYVVVEIYGKDTGSSYDTYIRRYVHVDVGTNGFGGTNLTIGWSPGSVSLTTTGNYAIYDMHWKDFTYGTSEPVQAKDAIGYYTSGSGNYYESYVSFTYTAPTPTTYTITYNANGGSGAPSSQTKTYGKALTLSSTIPTRSGYNFLGWATSSTATTATYLAGASYTANASATLYAVWATAVTYTVTYNANGGTGAPSSQTKEYGVSITLSSTKPTRSGYTFLGWGLSSTSKSARYVASATYAVNEDAVLYAVWKNNTQKIKIYSDDVVQAFEFIEDPSIDEFKIYKNGSFYVNKLIENENGAFSMTNDGVMTIYELKEDNG